MTDRRKDAYLRKKYGISVEKFNRMLLAQGFKCAICRRPFMPYQGELKRRPNVDHRHVKGYSKLPPNEKKKFVRGLLCYYCNKFMVGRHTLATIKPVYDYLRKSERGNNASTRNKIEKIGD